MAFRESEIAISHSLKWKLARIVSATQPTGLGNKETVESLVEGILTYWMSKHHPVLDKLWQEREAINDRAHQAVNERNQTK